MTITTEGMKLLGTQDWGSKLQSQYFLKCINGKCTNNPYGFSCEKEVQDEISMTKSVWDCGCTLVDKWELITNKESE